MKNPLLCALPLAFALTLLSACQQESAPALAGSSTLSQIGTATAPVTSPELTIQPAAMESCDPAMVAQVRWDVRSSHPATTDVEIWVGSEKSKLQLFAAGGAFGNAETGAWTRPGTRFVLKDKGGSVLGEASVGGPTCQ